LDRKHDDLKVAGCWVHCKRKYAEIVKTAKKGAALSPAQQIAREATERIAVIFPYRQSQQRQIVTGDS